MVGIPETAGDLTGAWLTQAIRAFGRPDWPEISSVSLERVGEGPESEASRSDMIGE